MAIKDKLFLEGLWDSHLDGKFELTDKNFQGCNRITHRTRFWGLSITVNELTFHGVVDGALKEPCSDVRATSQLPAPSPPHLTQLSLSLSLLLLLG